MAISIEALGLIFTLGHACRMQNADSLDVGTVRKGIS